MAYVTYSFVYSHALWILKHIFKYSTYILILWMSICSHTLHSHLPMLHGAYSGLQSNWTFFWHRSLVFSIPQSPHSTKKKIVKMFGARTTETQGGLPCYISNLYANRHTQATCMQIGTHRFEAGALESWQRGRL